MHRIACALSGVNSIYFFYCTRTSERFELGNGPYPKTLATILKTLTDNFKNIYSQILT